jgi:two-component system chemotaxis response regulator CheB
VNKIRVIVVDDSALVRKLLGEIINREDDMECVGVANDPLVAREMIRELNPDVITLDVEMPRMDGIEFLGKLMRLRPMPVLMVSTLTERGADVTMKALELGAVDFVAKPRMGVVDGLAWLSTEIVEKIRIAAASNVRRTGLVRVDTQVDGKDSRSSMVRPAHLVGGVSTEKMIFIGASTGGTEAIKEVLIRLPADSPAVAITQHMPAGFTNSFAKRLDGLCQISVREAVNGERMIPGHAYIAPGGMQFKVGRSGANYVAVVEDGDFVNRHKPSVEVLFRSAANMVGRNAYGIMLTGMGGDGAVAMKEMRDAGGYNFAQDEATCVVFGMPREAIATGAVHEILPVCGIAKALVAKLNGSADRFRL